MHSCSLAMWYLLCMLKHSMARSLHNYLKRFRIESGLSQDEVARLLGETRSMVARHELGMNMPKADSLLRYEVIYGKVATTLFRGRHQELADQVRQVAKGMFKEVPANAGRKVEALGRIAFPNDPIIVPLWQEESRE